jgi:nicotinamide phosphoribosyltransferase
MFPDNQPNLTVNTKEVSVDSAKDGVRVVARLRSSLDVMNLLQLSNALDHMFIEKAELVIPYLLGARSDRVMVPGGPVFLEVVADLINQCGFKVVNLFDPHSDVAPALIKHSKAHNNSKLVQAYKQEDAVLIVPDAGAAKKVKSYLGWNTNIKEIVYCSKDRNLATGAITLKVPNEVAAICSGRNCVIIDDICDGGATFTAIAQQLKEYSADCKDGSALPPKTMTLIVSHGIFSKGFMELEKYFDNIITSDSFSNNYSSKIVTVVPVFAALDAKAGNLQYKTNDIIIPKKEHFVKKEPNPLLLTDFYKVGHVFQYPEGTEYVYSNWTARKSRIAGVDSMMFFGLQMFCQRVLIDYFNKHFFKKPLAEVLGEYKRIISNTTGDLASYKHVEDLHKLGYLPIKIKAVKEGTLVPMRVPCLTVLNTLPEFYWVTNWVESLFSAEVWKMSTSATIAFQYRLILDKYAKETGMSPEFVQWQGHDFSFRGMDGWDSAQRSGMAHLLSFTGTDTIPAITGLEYYYGADVTKELVGGSVPATEHSVMCSGGKGTEIETFRRLITKVYPKGIVSIVSDTWDLWKVVTEYLLALKADVLARDGKVVIRPDSGDPELIICGNPDGASEAERKGVVQCLWEIFGGTTTDKGYKLLDSHIGVIYGDSITLERARAICEGLAAKGFASQVVLGIGSYTYQCNTRDTFGLAMKATYVEINGKSVDIFKDPVTDDGTKKSNCGLLKVYKDDKGRLQVQEKVTWGEEAKSELEVVFVDGQLKRFQTLKEIRGIVAEARAKALA